MLQFSFIDKEDMIKKINNGEVQEEIYRTLADILFDNTYYEGMCSNNLSKDTVYEYFEAEFEYCDFVSDEEIRNSENEVASILHNVIANVYNRFEQNIENIKKKNKQILAIMYVQEDLGFYSEAYNKNLLDVEDKNEIVKKAMEYYEVIKDIRF